MVRSRKLGQREDHLHHPLHLRLFGAAVAADRLLHAGGRVFATDHSRVGGRDEHDAACLPDGECDAGVCADERLLECHRIRRVLGNECRHRVVDRFQTEDRVLSGGRRPAAVRHLPEAASAFLDDSVPASSSPRIDAYDLHERKLRTRPDESCPAVTRRLLARRLTIGVVIRFAAVRMTAAVVATLILYAAFFAAASLPWSPLQGLSHSCPYGASRSECTYPSRPAWVLPTGLAIGLAGLAGAAGVLEATRRRPTVLRLLRRGR